MNNLKYLEGKTVLVTGSTGLIGSNLVNTLLDHGSVNVIANGRSIEKLRIVFFNKLQNKNLNLLPQDVEYKFSTKNRVDYIFHAAGSQENHLIRNYPTSIISANLNGLFNCLELQRSQNEKFGNRCRLVIFSSITIYENKDNKDKTFSEDETSVTADLSDPKIAYSESKRMCEVIARAFNHEFNADVVIARLSTVYGYSKLFTKTAFFDFVRDAVSGNDIVINACNCPKRDNIYINDAISGLLKVAESGLSGEAYNISSNKNLNNFASVYDIAKVIINCVESKEISSPRLICSENNSIKPGAIVLDNTKLLNLGWEIRTSLEVGIENTIDKYVKSIKSIA